MATPLLATKFYIPPPRPETVARPRLIDRLNTAQTRKMILVAAPAGYGKTTLVSEWVRQVEAVVAWLSLEKTDNDLKRFLAYLFAALQSVAPGVGQTGLAALQLPQLPPLEALLVPLINDLASLGTPIILVLDDYHLIEDASIHDALIFLVDHLPAQLHLAVLTRLDPPLGIARLRARGELVELRAAELRFTQGEVAEFLTAGMGLELGMEEIARLAARTEGWIAGLQLAAISMQGHPDQVAFVNAFSGSHEYIVDYLTDEVLKGQSEDVKTFLLETSLLGRLSGPLCEAVTGQVDSQARLERLREANLFIQPLDDERRWYRYHRLFADHLLKRLRQTHPARIEVLHGRASEWYERNGLVAEAIQHALDAGDHERAAGLIAGIAEETMMRSEFALFLGWLQALPEPARKAHASIRIAQAMSLLMTGNPTDQVELLLDDADWDTPDLLGGKTVVQATIAFVQGRLSRANELAQQAVDLLPESEKGLRATANWIASYSGVLDSKPSAALRTLEKVLAESRLSGNVMVSVAAYVEVAKLYAYQGQLQRAQETYEEVLDLAEGEDGKPLPIAGEALMGLGELSRQWNRLQDAEWNLVKGIELAKWGRETTAYRGFISLAKVRLALGDVDGALEHFREAERLATYDFDRLIVATAEAQAKLSLGDLESAEAWLAGRGWLAGELLRKDEGSAIDRHTRKYERLLQVRVFLAQNRFSEALACLAPLKQAMEQGERVDLLIEIQILEAIARQGQGEIDAALLALEVALSLASPGGYLRVFLDEGEPVRQLLRTASARGVAAGDTPRLLAAFRDQEPESAGSAPAEPDQVGLPEPLSDRELQVLRLLASPLTSPEIAAELYISVNTVRFHIKNIYGKLGAHRRSQAVDRARELGLI